MTIKARWHLLFGLLSAIAVVSTTLAADPPPAKGLAVHEWGMFRVHNDVELANADMRAIWEGLPKFVYGQVSGRDLPKHWQNIETVDKPVIFFHASEPVDVDLRIDFPTGIPALWWPGTESPAIENGAIRGAVAGKPAKSLQWHLRLKKPPENYRVNEPALPEAGAWAKPLRAVAADEVFSKVGERRFGYEREKFVYYDGLLPRGKWVEVVATKEKVTVRCRADHPVFDLTAIDRKADGSVRVARMAKLEGDEVKALDFQAVEKEKWPAEGVRTLTKQLTDAGLYEDEAGAMLAFWQPELFETEGLTIFYRLPQAEYERLLPMTMKPAPKELVRVGLVQHPHCEPDLPERVNNIVKDLQAPDFGTREKAQKRLDDLGRAAFVQLLRQRDATTDADLKRRLDELVEKYESRKAIVP
jgi:hypothetical protein